MATPAIPTSFYVQQGNGQVYLSWNLMPGATSYSVQRSEDGVTYAIVSSPAVPSYLDETVELGTKYYYKVASVNADGTSPYTSAQNVVPSPTAELSLGEVRQRAKERADRVNSQFVTLPEWNFFINQSMYELYDLLITTYENYFEAPEVIFNTTANDYFYPLPDGILTFTNSVTGQQIVAPPFYKLSGVDLGINNASNAFVTVDKYNLGDRNKFVYPNTASTIYGVFNLQYRLMGNKIRFIPTPSSGQQIRLLYIPRLPTLLADTDLTTIGYSGWLQYVIVRAAKYALDKEEADTSKLDEELAFLNKRIIDTAPGRDTAKPDTITDSSQSNAWGGGGPFNGFRGGW